MDVSWTYCGNHFTIYVNQIIMLYVYNLYSDVCQLFLNKAGKIKVWTIGMDPSRSSLTSPPVDQRELDKLQPHIMTSRWSVSVHCEPPYFRSLMLQGAISELWSSYFASQGHFALGSRVRAAHTSTLSEAGHSSSWQLKGITMSLGKGALTQPTSCCHNRNFFGHGCPNLAHVKEPLIWQSKPPLNLNSPLPPVSVLFKICTGTHIIWRKRISTTWTRKIILSNRRTYCGKHE